ncbi:hypothetical protein P9112_003495 [Eukaryota sp. TZLM1-RC]
MSLRFDFSIICTDCRSNDALLVDDYRTGNRVCTKCGLCSPERIIDPGGEWRSVEGAETEVRVGGPTQFFIETLSTTIGEDTGTKGPRRTTLSSKDYSLIRVQQQMNRLGLKLGLTTSVVNRGLELYQIVTETASLRGRSSEGVATACLFIAAREAGFPRTFKEFELNSGVPKKQLGRCYKFVLETSQLVLESATSPEKLVDRFVNAARLEYRVGFLAKYIAKKATSFAIASSRHPASIAGASIYWASKFLAEKQGTAPVTLGTLSDVVGISEVTLNVVYRELMGNEDLIRPIEVAE